MPAPPRALLLFGIGCALLIIQLIQRGSAVAQPAASPKAELPSAPPKPTLDTLENGLRVIVAERHGARLAAVDLRVRAGTAYETPQNNGVAHVIEHLLFKGTAARPPGDVDAAIESIGGELSANTSKDWAQFATVVPSSRWRTALEVLADVVQNPAFRAEDLKTEKEVILSEMAAADADATRAPFTALATVAFPRDHPYHLPLYGPETNVQNFTRDDLLRFWRAHYTPQNMTLVVVGDVKRADIVGAARALFAWPPGQNAPEPAADLPDPGPLPGIVRAQPLQRDRGLVSLVLGFRAPSVKAAEDAVAMDVLLQILAVGARGRLNDALVDKDLALAVSADYLTQRAPGVLTLTAIGRPGSEKRLEEALLAEVQRLREAGVTGAEVDAGRRALLAQTLFDEETYAGEANALAFYDAIDTYEFVLLYRQRIAAVGTPDIARVVRTYLTPDRYAVATVAPRSAPTAPSRNTEVSR
jgi:zinc protease